MKNKIFKPFLFITIFIFFFNWLFGYNGVLGTNAKDNTPLSDDFFTEKKEIVDVIFIGASSTYRSWIPTMAYESYGIASFSVSSSGQPLGAMKWLLEQCELRQSPTLYVLDIGQVRVDQSKVNEGEIRAVTDSVKFSNGRELLIEELEKYYPEQIDRQRLSWKYPFLLYHSRWKELNKYDFDNSSCFKGFCMSAGTLKHKSIQKKEWDYSASEPIDNTTMEILNDLINHIQTEKLNVLFIIPPYSFSKEDNSRYNYVTNLLESYGFDVCNWNLFYDDMGLNFDTDFYNEKHLNVNGAKKYTNYVSKYLLDNYQIPCRGDDDTYKSWNSESKRMLQEYEMLTK